MGSRQLCAQAGQGRPRAFAIAHTAGALAIAITPDGKTAYVVQDTGTVTPISTATNTPLKPIKTAAQGPGDLAVTPDGSIVYAICSMKAIVIAIKNATDTALRPAARSRAACARPSRPTPSSAR